MHRKGSRTHISTLSNSDAKAEPHPEAEDDRTAEDAAELPTSSGTAATRIPKRRMIARPRTPPSCGPVRLLPGPHPSAAEKTKTRPRESPTAKYLAAGGGGSESDGDVLRAAPPASRAVPRTTPAPLRWATLQCPLSIHSLPTRARPTRAETRSMRLNAQHREAAPERKQATSALRPARERAPPRGRAHVSEGTDKRHGRRSTR